jgi:hypothetical protein
LRNCIGELTHSFHHRRLPTAGHSAGPHSTDAGHEMPRRTTGWMSRFRSVDAMFPIARHTNLRVLRAVPQRDRHRPRRSGPPPRSGRPDLIRPVDPSQKGFRRSDELSRHGVPGCCGGRYLRHERHRDAGRRRVADRCPGP